MSEVNSPCVRNCCLNEEGICLGCFRSIEEIMQWHKAKDNEKLEILTLAEARRDLVTL